MINQKRVTKIKPFFRWYDLWAGAYIDLKHSAVYICPLPTVGVKIWREDTACCHWCGELAQKSAHHTGDGWALMWECYNDNCQFAWDVIEDIEWPFRNAWMNDRDLIKYGYTIV